MNKQRKVVITTTYNEMGIIIDTKVEEVAQPNLQPTCNQLATDTISRQAAIDALAEDMPSAYTPDGSHPADDGIFMAQEIYADCIQTLKELPSAQPEIIRCRECKFASGDSRICMKFGHSPIGELDFCSFAERREVTT